ncbi:MAG: GNAT family N-acetyltransferase [Actinomycetaceae bacterium]|nr:GNAT family N-acetyltransferase [Actinomycetaceae bacterium]MDY6082990.1 GNAT family N-acetyltransferase [Actinomycetaceae bacterium]
MSGTHGMLMRMRDVQRDAVLQFLDAHPVDGILARESVANVSQASKRVFQHYLPVLGWQDSWSGELDGVVFLGWNLFPVGLPDEALNRAAAYVASTFTRLGSIVGVQDQVLQLWDALQGRLGSAREIRSNQYCLVIDRPPLVQPDARLRKAHPWEDMFVLPAAIAMFREEMGYDPTTRSAAGFIARTSKYAAEGRTYIVTDPNEPTRVIFKADVGALSQECAQLQGVWTDPEFRGRGIARHALAGVVQDLLTQVPRVSLYVNSFNTRARAVYDVVGFREYGRWASVLVS